MSRDRSACATLVLTAVAAIVLALPAGAQTPPGAPAPTKPYKVVPVTLPQPSGDPAFAAFRKQILDIAVRRDRAALARLVANAFFWMGEKDDKADKKKPGIDNLAAVADLDAKDGSGWEALAQVVRDPTLERFPDRKGVMCSPAAPTLDEKAAAQLAKDTATQPGDWGYTIKTGLVARADRQPDAPVVEMLTGLHLIRLMPEDAPGVQPTFVRVVTPGGKLGFVPAEFVKTFPESQICYVKDAGGWKIAGVIGE